MSLTFEVFPFDFTLILHIANLIVAGSGLKTKMGAYSGNMSAPTTKTEQKKNPLKRLPSSKPPSYVDDLINLEDD